MSGKQTPGRGIIVVISGPSGVGKTTLVRRLLEDRELVWSVSATTRAMRPGEEDGKDYHFLTREDFERRVGEGFFVEHAESFGNLYGTPAEPLRRALVGGRTMVLDIDVQGARQVRAKFPEAVLIFIAPPSLEVLKQRLRNRGSESAELLERRMERVQMEMEARGEYNYVVVNDDLEEAVSRLKEIVAGLKSAPQVR